MRERSKFQERLIQRVLDDAPPDMLESMAMDYLDMRYDALTDEQLMLHGGELFPDLLENDDDDED